MLHRSKVYKEYIKKRCNMECYIHVTVVTNRSFESPGFPDLHHLHEGFEWRFRLMMHLTAHC